jgi:hypothetical protein
VIVGRPPENGDVVRIRRVRAPICHDEADHLIVVGLLTSMNYATEDEGEELPMVYVTGPRLLMRVGPVRARARASAVRLEGDGEWAYGYLSVFCPH